MKYYTKLLLILVLTFFTNYSFSQVTLGKNGTFSNKWYSGTLMLKNKDTLVGVVKFENGSATKEAMGLQALSGNNKIFYKKNKNVKKKTKFKKEEVEYFIIRNNKGKIVKYAYIPTSDKKLKLFQVLIEGRVSLYMKKSIETMYLDDGNTTTIMQHDKNLYYVKKSNEKFASNRFFANVFKSFKKTATRYFSDCKSVVSKINSDEYKSDQLFEIVKVYNNCK